MATGAKSRALAMPPSDQVALGKTHKAAIVLASLNAETASAIVNDISDAQLKIFAQAFSDLNSVSHDMMHVAAAEFIEELRQASANLEAGAKEARRVLEQLIEEERVKRIFGDEAQGDDETSIWEKLEATPNDTLAAYLQKKKPQVATAIISRLGMEKTASVLEVCESDFAKSVLFALSSKGPPPDSVVDEIGFAIEKELLANSPETAKPTGLSLVAGEIINFLPAAMRNTFLEFLMSEDPDVGKEVRKAILTFEELHARLPQNAVTILTREVDRDTLMTALKYGEKTAPETVEFILGNISKRMAEQYREDLEDMEDAPADIGDKAHRDFTSTVKRIAAEGDFELNALVEPEAEPA